MADNRQDITKTGPQGLSGVRGKDLYTNGTTGADYTNPIDEEISEEDLRRIRQSTQTAQNLSYLYAHGHGGKNAFYDPGLFSVEPANIGFGESMFDSGAYMDIDARDVQNLRAENQPWYAKIGAGVAKGVITAGTTFINGTLGLVDGLIEGIATQDISKIWDNSVSNVMDDISKWQEEFFPNYRTTEEEEKPWWQNLGTANFWGDSFIKNIGFTVGAFYAGGGWTTALSAIGKFAQVSRFINTASKAAKATKALAGAAISAVGEGSIEAINARNEFIQNNSQFIEEDANLRKQQALMEYEQAQEDGTNMEFVDGKLVDTAYEKYKQAITDINQARENSLAKIHEDATHVGNMTLALNIPILTVGNIIQFGRLYAGGYNAARLGSRIGGGLTFGRDEVGRLTLQSAYKPGTSKLHSLLSVKSIFTEGNEEMAQRWASESTEDYYSTDVNAYYAKQYDPNAIVETTSWIKSFGRGIAKSYGDAAAWEEGFIGGLTGALGMPKFRSSHRTVKNSDGTTTRKWQSPIILQEGIWGGIRDYRESREREKRIADALNARINTPDYLNQWRSFIRSRAFQNDMDIAAFTGDVFKYKNAQFGQLINDIELFKKAGKLDDLREIISQASDTSDESIDDIIANTSSIKPEGHNYMGGRNTNNRGANRRNRTLSLADHRRNRRSGNAAQDNTTSIDTEMPNIGSVQREQGPFIDKKRDQVRAELTKGRDKILGVIDEYSKVYSKVDSDTGGVLDDDTVAFLTQLRMQTNDWKKRGGNIAGHIRAAAKAVFPNISTRVYELENMLQNEKLDPAKRAEKRYELQRMEELMSVLQDIESLDSKTLAKKISLNKKKSFWNRATDAYSAQSIADLMSAVFHHNMDIVSEGGEVLEKDDLVKEIDDLVRMNQALETYNKKIAEYTGDPNKILTDQDKTKEEIAQAVKYFRKQRAYHASQGAKSARDLETALNMSTMLDEVQGLDSEGDIQKEVIEDLAALGDKNAKELMELDNYEKDVRAEIDKSQASQAAKDAAHQLLSEHRDASASLEALADPSLTFMTQDHFTSPLQEGENVEDKELTDDYQEGMDILEQARVRVNNTWDSISTRFGDKYLSSQQDARLVAEVDAIIADNKRKADIETESARDNTTTVPPVNEGTTMTGQEGSTDIDNTPIGTYNTDSPGQELKDENAELDKEVISDDSPIEDQNNGDIPPRRMIITIIPYFDIDSRKQGIYVPFGERQSHTTDAATGESTNFSYIYNHLIQRGAFRYVDDGNLKEGDRIGFMIDPEFEKGKYDEANHYPSGLRSTPTIFMVVKTGPNAGQIVGVVPSLSSQSHYWGLDDIYDEKGKVLYKGLINSLIEEYEAWDSAKNPGKIFISDKYTTKVSQIMSGSVYYSNDENVLTSSTEGGSVLPAGYSPIFGVTNGTVIQTNRPDLNGKIITPKTITPGRLYLYVPNIRGTYSPIAVRAKRLSQNEFNLREDSNTKPGSIGEEIKTLLDNLASARNNNDVTEVWNALKEILYIENVKITYEETDSQGREYSTPRLNIDYIAEEEKKKHRVPLTGDINKDSEEILKVLEGFNLPIQIKASKINSEKGYNDRLLSSGVLTSNITEAKIVGNWFATDFYNPETGKFEEADHLDHKVSTLNPGGSSVAPATAPSPASPTNVDNGSPIPGIKIEGDFPIPSSRGSESYSGRVTTGVFYVDLKDHTVRTATGILFDGDAKSMMIDIAYLQSVSDGSTEIPGMMHLSSKTGKVFAVINRGETNQRVINVSERKYVYGKQAEEIANWFTKQISPKPKTTTTAQAPQTPPTSQKEEGSGAIVLFADFQIGDKIYKGRVFKIGEVGGYPIRMSIFKEQRDPLEGEGDFGKIEVNMVYAIFPNGLAVPVYKYGIGNQELIPKKVTDDALSMLKDGLEQNPDAFKQLATKETLVNKGQPQTKNTEGTEEQPEVRLDEVDGGKILVINNSRVLEVGDTVTFEEDGSTKRAIIDGFIPLSDGTFVVELYEPETAAKEWSPVYLTSKSEIASLQKDTSFTRDELRKESSEIYKNLEDTSIEEKKRLNANPFNKEPALAHGELGTQGSLTSPSRVITFRRSGTQIGYIDEEYKGTDPEHYALSPYWISKYEEDLAKTSDPFVIKSVSWPAGHRRQVVVFKDLGGMQVFVAWRSFTDNERDAMRMYMIDVSEGRKSYDIEEIMDTIDKIMHTSDHALHIGDFSQLGNAYTESTSTTTTEKPATKRKGINTGSIRKPKTGTTEKKASKKAKPRIKPEDQSFIGVKPEKEKSYGVEALEDLFNRYNIQDAETKALAAKVFKVAKRLGINITFTDALKGGNYGNYTNNNTIRYQYNFFTDSTVDDTFKAQVLLHELIHAVTSYALTDQEIVRERLTPKMKKAVTKLKQIFEELKKDPSVQDEYGITNVHEMVAELSNPEFRDKLKKISLWDRIVNAIKEFFGLNVYEATSQSLEDILDNFDLSTYNFYNGIEDRESNNYSELSQETKEILDKKGYSEEKFDSFPRGMKDHILKCVGF